MKRVAKPEGRYNIVIEEVDMPEMTATQVLVNTKVTLISRGSEIWRRYVQPGPIEHRMMGYSLTGTIEAVGNAVTKFAVGDRVAVVAPHAEYVVAEAAAPSLRPTVVHLPETVSFEAGTFWPLTTSSVLWVQECGASSDDTLAILGQGLVGSLCMQTAKSDTGARVIAVDALPLRCEFAKQLGADAVVNAKAEDPVAAVRNLTDGAGADIVMEAVGGRSGAKAFEQAQDMVKSGGLIHIIGLYEDEPLPLNSSKIMGRRLIGGYLDRGQRPAGSEHALQLLAEREVQAEKMITHRFPFIDAAEAFSLLYNRLGETLGVVLIWE